MNLKNITFPQVLLILGLLAAVICAHRFVSPSAGAVVSLAGIIVAWFTNTPGGPSAPAIVPAIEGAGLQLLKGGAATALCLALAGCSLFSSPVDRSQLEDNAAKILKCQEEGRAAPDGGHIAAYDDCKKREGL